MANAGEVVLDFLTNLCGLNLGTAVPKVKGFLDAGISTRAQLFALTDSELKDCGLTHAAQRKKVSGGHSRWGTTNDQREHARVQARGGVLEHEW